MNELMHDMVV